MYHEATRLSGGLKLLQLFDSGKFARVEHCVKELLKLIDSSGESVGYSAPKFLFERMSHIHARRIRERFRFALSDAGRARLDKRVGSGIDGNAGARNCGAVAARFGLILQSFPKTTKVS